MKLLTGTPTHAQAVFALKFDSLSFDTDSKSASLLGAGSVTEDKLYEAI